MLKPRLGVALPSSPVLLVDLPRFSALSHLSPGRSPCVSFLPSLNPQLNSFPVSARAEGVSWTLEENRKAPPGTKSKE